MEKVNENVEIEDSKKFELSAKGKNILIAAGSVIAAAAVIGGFVAFKKFHPEVAKAAAEAVVDAAPEVAETVEAAL